MCVAIQSDTPSDLITIDRDYLDRVTLRRSLIQRHASTVHGYLPAGEAAVAEVYAYLFASYLPTRYPTVFTTSPPSLTSSSSSPPLLHNAATGLSLPAEPSPCALENLRRLGETVEEDMFPRRLRRQPEAGPSIKGDPRARARVRQDWC